MSSIEDVYPHPAFATLPLRDHRTGNYKKVSVVPGITPACEAELAKIGCTLATHLLSKFMIFNMDKNLYVLWFLEHVKVENVIFYADESYNALKEWFDMNM